MALLNKLGDFAKNIGDKASDAIDTKKLNNKINAEKAAVAECMRKIGEVYYKRHQDGAADDPEVAELYAAADGHNKTIEDTQAEIAHIQEQAQEAAQAAPAQATAPAPSDDGLICSACNAKNPAGTKFCAECGAKLESPAPADRSCPQCGAKVSAAGKFCVECGYKFEN